LLQSGTQVGRYEIQRRIGRGGMGTVYVAHDPVLRRMVAIKVFLSDLDLPDAVERFTREARSAAALNHTNIVTIHDYGEFDSQPYIVMEYVQGETLTEIIGRKAPVSIAEKLRWIEELCAGVAYAHRVGVIHRDIKPTNLMIDGSGRLKILDFGIARMLGTLASNATALIGTPGYMAPEQILGGTIDFRSDLFSVGVVSYELLSYTEAFPGESLPAVTHRILSHDPIPLSEVVPGISLDVMRTIERALKKSADERFADAESFQAAIGQLRREADGDRHYAPSTLISRTSAEVVSGTESQGSARREAAAVGALTPPPDPIPLQRYELLRRRTTQIEASLARSRSLLGTGELDAALEACIEALTIDDQHSGALELERTIQTALAPGRAETQTQIRPVESAAATVIAGQRTTSAGHSSDKVASRAGWHFDFTKLREKPTATISSLAAVVVIAVAVAATTMWLGRQSVAPTGTALLEAIPWANIVDVEATDGTHLPLPPAASTPMILNLPAGTYRIRLVGPPPDSEPRLVTADVVVGRMTRLRPERFRTLTAEEYFEPYLTPLLPQTSPGQEERPTATEGGAR
jgi:serine/threonine protein kinase